MKRNRGRLAFRETFWAGRLGIRAKILIYLAPLAGFMISMVWLLQGTLFYAIYGVSRAEQSNKAPAVVIRNMDRKDYEALTAELGAEKDVHILRLDQAMQWEFWITSAGILLATGLVGYTMAKSVSEPIIETNLAARELSRGRYTRPAHSGGYREIAELNDTLIRAAEDLNRVEDLQRELIANISHDLRTPLTMIQGYAEAMRDIPDEITAENMQIIIDETNRLSTMVNEVLDFSRLRSGALEMHPTVFNLTRLIREIVNRVSKMTAVEGYTVRFDGEAPEWVSADSGRISQVVYNLVGNALTYTGEDKTVTISLSAEAGLATVRISDTGEGISREELPFIWDRYYRSRENHRRAVLGSGLGLNICRGILEKHGADYGADSVPGRGTTFWFRLPLADPPAADEDPGSRPAS